MIDWRKSALRLAALTLLSNLALAMPVARYGAAFFLLWILPGLAWALLLAEGRGPGVEEVSMGLGLGIGSVALLVLLFHYLPGPLPMSTLLIGVNLLTFALVLLARRRGAGFEIGDLRFETWHLSFVVLVLVAAFFRLTHLGYSEFQGDEGVVMTRAARAIMGDDAQLFYHQKGPFEVLLPLATWRLSGTINEWQARLPFAFTGLLGVAALYLIGRRWLGQPGALIGGLLLAINGYFVGFGRIVQYQSVVLAMTNLALLALWRWSEGDDRRWLNAGAALLAFGILGHYDTALALPAAVYVAGRRLWPARSEWRSWLSDVMRAAALAVAILGIFYLPFACNPNFVKTLRYLSSDRIGTEGPLYNHLLSSFPLATFYNASYYLIGLAGLLAAASFSSFRRLGLLVPTVTLVCLLALPSSIWIGPVLACLLAALLFSPRTPTSSRAAWLWFGVPFLFYNFLVWDPRTHVLNAFPGAVLLAASVLDRLFNLLKNKTERLLTSTAALAIFLLLAYHPYVMFIQHNPEVKRTWPDHRPALYWRPDETPRFGYFGFPYRAGWKVVGALIEQGKLDGVYASNEEQEVAGWYARGMERTYCPDPEWYVIAKNVQDEVSIPEAELEVSYHLWGEVQIAGKPKLWIYHRGSSREPPRAFHVEAHASTFDAHTTPAQVASPPPIDHTPAGHTLGEKVRLLGYRLDTSEARPGGSIDLVLYWEALQPLENNYQVFNHLYDGTMWGQQDGTPACAFQPTVLWEPGQIVRDEYTIPIGPSAPKGAVPLLVGMYDLITGERLPVRDPDGHPVGDAISLATVTIR